MKFFVCIVASQKRLFLVSSAAAVLTGAAIKFLGAPPVMLAVVAFGGSILVAATLDWARRHPPTN
jgi:hypothetical protein